MSILKKSIAIVLLAAMAVSMSGCFLLPSEEELLAPPLVEPEKVEYVTQSVEKGDISSSISGTAYFVSSQLSNVYFTTTGGRIAKINYRSGSKVNAGDILMELDSESVINSIRDQKLSLEKAKNAYTSAKEAYESGSAARSAEIDIITAKIQLDDLKAAYFAAQDAVSINPSNEDLKKKLDDAGIAVYEQELRIEKLEIAYQNALSSAEKNYENAKIDYQTAQNRLDDLELAYERTVLRAPISGTITYAKKVDIGQNVSTYETLYTISDPANLTLGMEGEKCREYPVGLEVEITYDKKQYKGIVTTNPSTNPRDENGEEQVYTQFEIFDFDFTTAAQGDSVQIKAVLDSRKDVIVIPRSCVNAYLGRKYVNILVDGVKVEKDIEVGLEGNTHVEVLEGLEVGDLLIIQ